MSVLRTLSLYCPNCHCTRTAQARRGHQKRKTGKRAVVIEVFCNSCHTRIQYGLPPQEVFHDQTQSQAPEAETASE